MVTENSVLKASKRALLLLVLLCSSSFAFYQEIYPKNKPEFSYFIEDNKYKVVLKGRNYISYVNNQGFKLYLPSYLSEYSLEILRFNSIGYINGVLSNRKQNSFNRSENITFNNLEYYITDYNHQNRKQLEHLLNKKVIPYKKSTSIVIEGYNIPKNISLNKELYFSFIKKDEVNNPLQELVYSFSMSFDKKTIDSYVKKNLDFVSYDSNPSLSYIYTYIQNLEGIKEVVVKKEIRKTPKIVYKKKESNEPKSPFSLGLKRVYVLKDLNLDNSYFESLSQKAKYSFYKKRYKKSKEYYLEILNSNSLDLKTKREIYHNLATVYSKISSKKAIEYFKKAKQKESYYNLAFYYYNGIGTKESDKKAYSYIKKSANMNFSKAIMKLRIMKKRKIGTL